MSAVHGGLDLAELRSLGLRQEQVLDFSSNINPLGPSPWVRAAAAEADLSSYPDRHSLALREALSERLGVGKEWLLIGNGTTELIHLLARAHLRPGGRCLVFDPTFGEYRTACALAGARVFSFPATRAHDFRWPVETALRKIEETRPRLVFLCNPNNPTGVYLTPDVVQPIRGAAATRGVLVLDDAYASLADRPWDTTPLLGEGSIAILRSLTKDHALAGIRLGYLVAHPALTSAVRRLQPAWSVNAVAQAAGLATLEDGVHLERARAVISESKQYLCGQLDALGIAHTRSAANFILARVGAAASLRTALLRRGIAVRDCASFGLPDHIRIAVRRVEECARLVEALEKEITGAR